MQQLPRTVNPTTEWGTSSFMGGGYRWWGAGAALETGRSSLGGAKEMTHSPLRGDT